MKKILLLTSAIVSLGIVTVYSQVVYHDISPDTTVNTWNTFVVHPPAFPAGTNLLIWWHPTPEVVAQTHNDCEILFTGTYPAKLNMGDNISASSGTWAAGNYDAMNSAGTGNWQTNATDKYLAFRFKVGTNYYYGWLKMSVAASAASFTVKEWAYNATANSPINAGQTATSGIPLALGEEGNISAICEHGVISFHGLPVGKTYTASIIDMNGRRLCQKKLEQNQLLYTEGMSTGIYVIQVFSGEYTYRSKLVIP